MKTKRFYKIVVLISWIFSLILFQLEKELSATHKKKFILNSFLLLRDSSMLGFNKSEDWIKENLIDKNIFRLNWHDTDEKDNIVNVEKLPESKNYMELIMEKTI